MHKSETSSVVGQHEVTSKFEVKHAFGCQVPKLDPIASFSSQSGDKEYSDRLVFKVGKQACIFNPETGKQDFFDRPKHFTDVLHFSVSPNNRFVSMCETTRNEKTNEMGSQVSVYSLSTLNRLKTLTHSVSRPFVCSAFCGDPKLLAALTDEPDRHIVVWQWEKEKLYKTVTLSVNVSILRSAPCNSLMLTTTGHGVLKNWCIAADAMLRSNNFLPPAKEASENFLDHVWLPSSQGLHKMVALADAEAGHESAASRTRKQNVYIFEGRETPHSSNLGTPSAPAMPIGLELKQTLVLKLELGCKVEKIITSPKVFMLVGNFGLVATYERTDDKHDPYIETRRISLGDKHLIGGSIYPSEERMVLVTKNSRMFNMALDVTIDQIKMSSNNHAAADDDSAAEDASQSTLGQAAKLEKRGTHGVSDLTPGGYHCAQLLGADLAYERPLMVTISADCTARIWNYQMLRCELTHDFGVDEPLSVAFHSSGFQVLVAFKDRIKLYNVLMDKLKQSKEAILKNCKCIKFSNGSQYWAAASAINIVVYETKSFQQLMTFQGHMMSVVKLTWAPGDQVLFSAGLDGNVYGWPIAHAGRMDVIVASNRSSQILDIEVDSPSTIFQSAPRETDDESGGEATTTAVGFTGGDNEANAKANRLFQHNLIVSSLDGSLRVPGWSLDSFGVKHGGGGASKAITSSSDAMQSIHGDPGCAITALQLSPDRSKLYVGTSLGTLRVYAWPPEILPSTAASHGHGHGHGHGSHSSQHGPSVAYYEIYTHAGPVVAIKLSPVDHTVISAGADGSVYVHNEVVPHAKQSSGGGTGALDLFDSLSDVVTLNDDVVLMSAEDIEEHINEIINLQKELLETNNKNEFHTRKVASDHAEQVKALIEQHDVAINREREVFENYKGAAEKRISDFANSVEAKDADNQKMRTELENKYEHKLAESLERYDALSEKMQLLKQKCEGLLEAEKTTFNKQLNDLKMDNHNREKKLKTDHRRAVDDKNANEAAFMEILKQQEDEYEDELKQMIDAVNFELVSERETISKLRALVQTKNTKLAQLKKRLIELNASAQQHAARVVEEVNARKALLATIEHYKKNLVEREEALAEKEKDVLELRSTTRTLENFRFVLDHRLQQLSSERGPITTHIEGLEKHISTMYEELVEEFNSKKANAEATALQEQKIMWISQDLAKMRQSVREKEQYITAFKRELNNIMSSMVVGKELEESVKLLYKKFVRGESESKAFVKIGDHIMEKVGELIHGQDADDHSVLSMDTADKRAGHIRHHHAENAGMAQEIDEALMETAKEADRQKKFVETQSNMLRHRLRHVTREAHSMARHRLNENSNLLFECNDLRMEAKELNRKLAIRRNELDVAQRTIKELKAQLSSQSRLNSASGEGRPTTATRNLPPVSTMVSGVTGTLPAPASASAIHPDGSAGAAETLDSRLPAQWVVHNALHRPGSPEGERERPEPSAEPTLAPIRGKPLIPESERKLQKSAVSHSAPTLHDPKGKDGSPPMKPTATFSASVSTDQLAGLGVGMTKHLTLAVPRATDLKVRRKPSVAGSGSLTGTDWQVDKLSKEVANLASQLDEALREKELQRIELNRLRKIAMTTSTLANTPSHLQQQQLQQQQLQAQALTSSSLSNAMQLQLPSLTRSSVSYTDEGIQHHQPSHSELYGVPSEAEKEDLQLRPVSSGNPAQGAARSSQNAYLSNPNIVSSRMGSGRMALSPKRFQRSNTGNSTAPGVAAAGNSYKGSAKASGKHLQGAESMGSGGAGSLWKQPSELGELSLHSAQSRSQDGLPASAEGLVM